MKYGYRIALCLLAAVFSAGCESLPLFEATPLAGPVERDVGLPQLENRIFVRIEEARQRLPQSIPPLACDPALTEVARQRSEMMAAAAAFADTAGDPHVSASLLMARDPSFQGRLSENVAAQHIAPGGKIDVEALAGAFVAAWMNDPQHKESLLFSGYNRGGVGVAANRDTIYATLLFAADLPVAGQTDSASGSQGATVANSSGEPDHK
jgi:uncharacterized protein YkwD